MNDERALVVPTGVVTIGTRALDVPRGRRVLCVSCILAFRIEDAVPVDPRDWYGAVASHAGPMAIPDSTAPLPGAEVLVLGPVGPVSEEPSRARLAVSGGFDVELVLRSDATDSSPGSTVRADFARAVLHPEHNPQGRDPDGDPPPAVLLARNAEQPVWLGSTPPPSTTPCGCGRREASPTSSKAGAGLPMPTPGCSARPIRSFAANASTPARP